MKIKTTVMYHLTPVRLAIIKIPINNKCWRGCGEKDTCTPMFIAALFTIARMWTDAETEAPILWLPDVKNLLIGKDPDAGKDGRQRRG